MITQLVSSMRPFITVAFTGLVIYLTITGKIEANDVFTVASTIVAFWFGERAALKQKDAENDPK